MFSSRAPQSPRPHRPARITGRILLALALAIGVGVALAPGAPRAQAAACTTPVLDIVAHEDDSLLFQSPDLLHAIQQGWCVRTVFMTAGDDGRDQTYWQGREAGALAAYAQMAGVSNTWVQSDAGISGHPMPLYTLAGAPQVSLIFMRLPDGNADGSGFPSTGNTSMQQLWQNNIASLSAIDGSSSYTRQGLINTILALMQSFQPVQIRVQDYMGSYGDGDHSDHHTSAYIAQAAHQQYTTPHTFIGYMDYNTTLNPQNVTGTDLTNKQNAFYTYAPYDPNVCQTEAACSGTNYQFWLQRQYTVGSENGGTGSYQSPTANAGANQSVASNVQVQLDGSASSDPNGKALTYRWTQMGGPSVTLSSSTTVKPTFTSPYGPTTLLFQLVVNNGTSASAPADVTISVAAPAAGSGPPCPCSVFGSSATPTTANAPDTGSYELGMKFQVTNAGSVTGVRFYKGSQNTGTHTGSLWDANGNLLATATFTNETASGWQQVRFSNPVAIAANTTYVVSYHTDVGHFSVDRPYFTAANSNLYSEVPVRPMEDGGSAGSNGVYSDTGFPTNSYDASNYWVDVVFTTNYGSGSTAPTVTSVSPANGASGVVATSPVTATFSSAMNAATITTSTFTLKDSQGNAVSATVTYNSSTNTATLTPTVVLGASTTYTATLNGVQDTNGTPLQQAYSWSFTTAATSYATPPTVASVTPTSGATGIGLAPSVTATFSQQLDPATVTTSTVQLLDASHATVAATVAYNNSTSTVTLTPSAALAPGTTYTAVVHGGSGGVKNAGDTPLAADYTWSFTTQSCPCSVWSTSTTPGTTSATDTGAYELGMKFETASSGYVTGVRFYKGSQNTGTHTGSLWDSAGHLLGTVTFTNETASGWQTASFASPVQVSAHTVYVISYHTDVGHFAVDRPYFTAANAAAYTSGVVSAMTDGGSAGSDGVYAVGASAFPTQTYDASNYWVDAIFVTALPPDTTPPTVTGVSPANGATGAALLPTVTATFSEALNSSTVTTSSVQLLDASNNPVAATVSYHSGSASVTLTPSAVLTSGATYTLVIHGGSGGVKDLAGNALASDYRSSFTVQQCPCSVWSTSTTPTTASFADANAYELGMKFQVAVPGKVTGVRFYKGPQNTGTHTGSLWDASGTLLATVTFTNETASGWQSATFSAPVSINANTTYVISYHTNTGGYALDRPYFTSGNAAAYSGGTVYAMTDGGPAGSNGVYAVGASSFPNQTYGASNYWVDVIFSPN